MHWVLHSLGRPEGITCGHKGSMRTHLAAGGLPGSSYPDYCPNALSLIVEMPYCNRRRPLHSSRGEQVDLHFTEF